jgi:hypothetical protein
MRSFSDESKPARLRSILSRSSGTSPDSRSSSSQTATSKKQNRPGTRIEFLGSSFGHTEPKKQVRRYRSYSSLEKLKPSSLSKQLSLSTRRQWPSVDGGSQDTDRDSRRSFEDHDWGKLLHHGQVHVSHSTWRRKHEYLVLTEKALLRFKSSKKAADYFPWIVPIDDLQHSPSSSTSSYIVDEESGRDSPLEPPNGRPTCIALRNIVAVRLVNDTPSKNTVELIYQLEDRFFGHAVAVCFQVQRSNGHPHWLEQIAIIAKEHQSNTGWQLPQDVLNLVKECTTGDETAVKASENRSTVYFVNQKSSSLGPMTVSEDTTKDVPALGLLINGTFQTYIVSFAKKSSRRHHSEDRVQCESHGFVSLVSATISEDHETVRLVFRNPQMPPVALEFETIHGFQLLQELHANLGRLIPSESSNPFLFRVPVALQSELKPIERRSCASFSSFQHKLKGFSLAFGLEVDDFNIEVLDCLEDSPALILRPRTDGPQSDYTFLHLIAFLRSLRQNECYVTVSLAEISLDSLLDSYDYYGDSVSGTLIHICDS